MTHPSCTVCGAQRLGDPAGHCSICTHREPTGSFYCFRCKQVSDRATHCTVNGCYPEEPAMTDEHPNLALQLSLLAWKNMEQFIEGGYEPDTLLAICKNNIAVLEELKND